MSLAAAAKSNVIGSGGGFSTIEATPSYQQFVPGTHNYHAVRYLTPTNYKTVPNTELVEPDPGLIRACCGPDPGGSAAG